MNHDIHQIINKLDESLREMGFSCIDTTGPSQKHCGNLTKTWSNEKFEITLTLDRGEANLAIEDVSTQTSIPIYLLWEHSQDRDYKHGLAWFLANPTQAIGMMSDSKTQKSLKKKEAARVAEAVKRLKGF